MSQSAPQLDVLFVSELPVWPLDQGFRIRGSNMAKALAAQGVRVGLASITALPRNAPDDLQSMRTDWPVASTSDVAQLHAGWSGRLSRLRQRLAERQGMNIDALAGVVSLVRQHRPRLVIGLGPHSPALLRAVRGLRDVTTIWYAADEQVHFNVSCMSREPWRKLPVRIRRTLVFALFENLFARGLDGAVGVSPRDAQLLRTIAGVRNTITIRNGVDTEYHCAQHLSATPKSLVFWGRLDFEPNIDAVCWFARKVWPALRSAHREAVWQIIGLNPDPRVTALAAIDGIEVVGPVDDIRPHACGATVTILPMRCGGGIKNKLLEAAAMARPILASPRAIKGLDLPTDAAPLLVCKTTDDWASHITQLWDHPTAAAQLGARARQWIQTHHTWSAAAEQLLNWATQLRGEPIAPKSSRHIADTNTGVRRAA